MCGDNDSVHPHGRGDNLVAAAQWVWANGSPPRAWGQCTDRQQNIEFHRFTPTGVGTMTPSPTPTPIPPVHPHGRGDNSVTPSRHAINVGSPPRAWGQSLQAPARSTYWRFTPTGVGTISSSASPIHILAVHPHGRGDNESGIKPESPGDGSPPRAWEQSLRHQGAQPGRRFTPTGVGTMPIHH